MLARNWAQPSHSQHFLFPRCARDVPNDALDFTSNYVMVSLRLPTNQFVQYQSNVQPNRRIKLHFHSETFPTLQSDSSLLKGSVTVSDSHWIGVNCVGAQKVFLEVLGFYSPPFHFLASQVQKNVLEKNLAPSTNQMRYARSEIRFLGNLAFKLHILFALYGETNSELSRWNNSAMDALDGISFLLPYWRKMFSVRVSFSYELLIPFNPTIMQISFRPAARKAGRTLSRRVYRVRQKVYLGCVNSPPPRPRFTQPRKNLLAELCIANTHFGLAICFNNLHS